MAQVAKQNGYCRPELIDSEDQLIEIVDGRHPLQEMYVDNFICNDTSSSREAGLVKIIMGPNSSGKSVYLKQVALIAYLAHTGSFVPATSARIGILDQIHTRIQTTESVSTQLSAFLIDIRQMTLSIFNSTIARCWS
ncbi:DNA mismatch repair protein MSH5-like [Nilaparvata lugens]|uniref:DNA mismatch repair protein MSH5-like n=1 Tax=Nilaparvata lugens TaxID=108931 RepID=UPI00193EA148|nr:DNA mismatch repair protein MSH5-like [Nilaparvata lugens]